jgi:thymidylate kinase
MIIAIDGYDGSGKTTIALQISKRINGTYVKSYNNDLGRVIWSLINDEEYELASLIARTACRKEAERYKDAPYVIFDRHWMTMFTLIPEEFLDSWYVKSYNNDLPGNMVAD